MHGSQVATVWPTTHQGSTVAQVPVYTAMHATSARESTPDFSAVGRGKRGERRGSQEKHSTSLRKDRLPTHKPDLPTSVDIRKLAPLLDGFPPKSYIIEGFTHGFRIHYEGDDEAVQSKNSQAALEHTAAVDEKLEEELTAGRIRGPFDKPPLPHFKCSPLSVREKSTPGTYRLLHNLSAPYDERAVNYNIPHEHTTVHYARLRDAIELIQEVGPGAYMSKADIKNAFRLVPTHPDYYHLFGFYWKGKYYYDTCLAMGLAEFFSKAFQTPLHIY